MRALREDERDEIESVKYLIKHVITKPNVEGFRVLEVMLALNDIGNKYVLSGIISDEELKELTDLDDAKELLDKLMGNIINSLETRDVG